MRDLEALDAADRRQAALGLHGGREVAHRAADADEPPARARQPRRVVLSVSATCARSALRAFFGRFVAVGQEVLGHAHRAQRPRAHAGRGGADGPRRAASNRRQGRAPRHRRASSSSPQRGSRSTPPRPWRGRCTSRPVSVRTRSRNSAWLVASLMALVATAWMQSAADALRVAEVREHDGRLERALDRLRAQLAGRLQPLADAHGEVDLVGPLPPPVGSGEDDEPKRVRPHVDDRCALLGHGFGDYGARGLGCVGAVGAGRWVGRVGEGVRPGRVARLARSSPARGGGRGAGRARPRAGRPFGGGRVARPARGLTPSRESSVRPAGGAFEPRASLAPGSGRSRFRARQAGRAARPGESRGRAGTGRPIGPGEAPGGRAASLGRGSPSAPGEAPGRVARPAGEGSPVAPGEAGRARPSRLRASRLSGRAESPVRPRAGGRVRPRTSRAPGRGELFRWCMNNSPSVRRQPLRAWSWSICSCLT